MDKRDQERNNKAAYLHNPEVKSGQEDKKYVNKNSKADKTCTDMVKIGVAYGSGQGVDTARVKIFLLKPIENTTMKNRRKKHVLMKPKSRSPKSAFSPPQRDVTSLVVTDLDTQRIGQTPKSVTGKTLQGIFYMMNHS